jgi:exopolysaccharide biosynthesis predicted pyruvyltransferase EpsI
MPESQYTNVGEAGLERCIYPSMNDWLSAFYYSDVVITDSFHGTVFAVMFNKPFLTVMNKGRGAPRFESFLGKLGLLSRLVDSVENVDEVLANLPEIDWSLVDGKLEAWRLRSLDFLDQNLPS